MTKPFYEIITSEGRKYLDYHCEKCKKRHLVRAKTGDASKLRTAIKQSVEVILWCGNGRKPRFKTEGDGLRQILNVKDRVPPGDKRKVKALLKRAHINVRTLPRLDTNILIEVQSLRQRIVGDLDRIEDTCKQLANQKTELGNNLVLLDNLEKGVGT